MLCIETALRRTNRQETAWRLNGFSCRCSTLHTAKCVTESCSSCCRRNTRTYVPSLPSLADHYQCSIPSCLSTGSVLSHMDQIYVLVLLFFRLKVMPLLDLFTPHSTLQDFKQLNGNYFNHFNHFNQFFH